MSEKVWNGTAWAPVKNQWVWNGSVWVEVKSRKAWDGDSWEYVWVPLTAASVTGPTFAMSASAGPNAASPNAIKPATFTVTLSKPASVQRVSLQLSYAGGAWTEYAAWAAPTTTTLTHPIAFNTVGAWRAQVVVTQWDKVVVTSAPHAIDCVTKTLYTVVSNANPTEGQVVRLSAGCSDGCTLPYVSAGWWHRWPGGGWNWSGGGNPLDWQTGRWGGTYIDWLWQETFADGSIINSAAVRVNIAAVVVNPYHIQAGMNRDQAQNVLNSRVGMQVLIEPAAYDWSGKIYVQANQHIVANGSSFVIRSGIVNAGAGGANSASGGGYSRAGGWTWEGGVFDGMNVRSTMFSLAHSPGFTIQGVRIRGCMAKGHGIEINSSGGAEQGGYTVNILNNVFDGVIGHRSGEGSYDEAIHIDYAWGASAATANPANDGTVCNNVLVQGNTVEDLYLHNPTGYPVGFGAHKFSISEGSSKDSNGNWKVWNGKTHNADGEARPVEYHAHILVQNNRFVVSPYSGTIKRGAVHMRGMARIVVQNNDMYSPSGRAACTHDEEYTKSVTGNNPPTNI